jgi:hypothetical protein
MKLYPGALNDELLELFDKEMFRLIPLKQIWEKFPDCRNITFVRHLESKYNEYKDMVKKTDLYKQFISLPNENAQKYDLAMQLLKDYRQYIGTDYQTDISTAGKQQGELYGKLYAELIAGNPHLFPTLIVASPSLRPRVSTHHFLKYIK